MADGAKDKMAKFKIGDRVAYKAHVANTAGELVEIRKPTSLEGVEMQYGIKQAGGAIMWVSEGMVVKASRPGAPDTFAVEDRFYFGKGRKERFASISLPRQSVASGASGTWKKREVTVRGKKAWLVELHRGSVLVGYLNQHPDTRQFHAFDGNTDQQIGVGGEAEMKRLVESL